MQLKNKQCIPETISTKTACVLFNCDGHRGISRVLELPDTSNLPTCMDAQYDVNSQNLQFEA